MYIRSPNIATTTIKPVVPPPIPWPMPPKPSTRATSPGMCTEARPGTLAITDGSPGKSSAAAAALGAVPAAADLAHPCALG